MILIFMLFTIDERYHTFDEVAYELDSIASHYESITHLDTIGYSTTDSMPIFAMKISDNVNADEDEPELLYVACHHAEEILGIEICMYMISDLISKYGTDSTITYWLNNREIWFVPLLNPEGHMVVMQEMDTIWRKNKRDNNNNGVFDLDYDGVDLNRNYQFYWDNGGSTDPPSEYYRGHGPFTEKEACALRDLCLAHNFSFCITYHSARTGLGEVVYFPWRSSIGDAPDFTIIRDIAQTLSRKLIDDQGTGHYTALAGQGVDGRARNWIYGICGTFTYCVEVSQTTIQPGWMVDDICERNLVGAYYLLERVESSGITGIISDEKTGTPLQAEVILTDYYDHRLPPRTSDPQYGRFLKIVTENHAGYYDVEVHKKGYESQYFYNVYVDSGQLVTLDVPLRMIEGTIELNNSSDDKLYIFPNPTHGMFVINMNNPLHFSSLQVYDISGRIVKDFGSPGFVENIAWTGTDELKRTISNGVYYVIGRTTDDVIVRKLVVFN